MELLFGIFMRLSEIVSDLSVEKFLESLELFTLDRIISLGFFIVFIEWNVYHVAFFMFLWDSWEIYRKFILKGFCGSIICCKKEKLNFGFWRESQPVTQQSYLSKDSKDFCLHFYEDNQTTAYGVSIGSETQSAMFEA